MNCYKAWLLICFSSYRHPFFWKITLAMATHVLFETWKMTSKLKLFYREKCWKHFLPSPCSFLGLLQTCSYEEACFKKPLLTACNIGYVAKKIGHIHPFLYGCEFYGDVLLLALFFPNMGLEPISHTNTSYFIVKTTSHK